MNFNLKHINIYLFLNYGWWSRLLGFLFVPSKLKMTSSRYDMEPLGKNAV